MAIDVRKQANQVRQSLGTVLAGERSIYWKLTARENLEYFAALYHLPPALARKRVDELLERMELKGRAERAGGEILDRHAAARFDQQGAAGAPADRPAGRADPGFGPAGGAAGA